MGNSRTGKRLVKLSALKQAQAAASRDVSVQQFTLLVNCVVFATLDNSLGSRCPKKGCHVCVECAKSVCVSESLKCPVCDMVVPEWKYAVKTQDGRENCPGHD